jgi:hypothetical protein
MALRFHCGLDGLEQNWVEVSDVWTRRELTEVTDNVRDMAVVAAYWQKKIVACHFERIVGPAIEDPSELTSDLVNDEVDIRLWDFLSAVLLQACVAVRSLGPYSGRLSSDIAGKKTTKTAE